MSSVEAVLSKVKDLLQANAVVGDEEGLLNKFSHLMADGVDSLQLIADFDDTLTKSFVDGKKVMNSFNVFTETKSLSKHYLDQMNCIYKALIPLAYNEGLEDQNHEATRLTEELYTLCVGEESTVTDVKEAVSVCNLPLKDGCEEMLSLLSKLQVPLTVVSAGSGDVIEEVIKGFGAKVFANFVKVEDGRITTVTKPTITRFNKHTIPLPVDEKKNNVILLGDFIWDSNMADGVPNVKTLIKICFFYGEDKEQIQRYLNYFDILLLNTESMFTVMELLKLVTRSS